MEIGFDRGKEGVESERVDGDVLRNFGGYSEVCLTDFIGCMCGQVRIYI